MQYNTTPIPRYVALRDSLSRHRAILPRCHQRRYETSFTSYWGCTVQPILRMYSKINADFLGFLKLIRTAHVILPMVLQICKTIVLQRVELDGKSQFITLLGFRVVSGLNREARFCRKTSLKVEMVTDEIGDFSAFRGTDLTKHRECSFRA